MPLKSWCSIHARCSKSSLKHSIGFCGIFSKFKTEFIAYRSSKVSDCIFEIHQLWQSGFSRVYSNCCCSCSFESEIITIGQSSHKIYSNNLLNFQECTTIVHACTKKKKKKIWKRIEGTSYNLRKFCEGKVWRISYPITKFIVNWNIVVLDDKDVLLFFYSSSYS